MTRQEWILNGDRGISSLTIFFVMVGVINTPARCNYRIDVPHDPADFGRCHALLHAFPAWRSCLEVVGDLLPKWRPMVAAWEELERLYEAGAGQALYQRMVQLEAAGYALECQEFAAQTKEVPTP